LSTTQKNLPDPKMRPLILKACTKPATFTRIPATIQLPRISKAYLNTSNLALETKHVTTAPGIKLSDHQETIVGSVLDLFAGRPTLPKLALWRDDATYTDPLTIATGRDKFSAQWYGLQKAFSEIDRLNHQVRDAGNPMLMDLRIKYVVRGLGKEQMIQSEVAIHLDEEGKIKKVEDKWNGELPEGVISNVSRARSVREGLVC
jgi:hypothetical protein